MRIGASLAMAQPMIARGFGDALRVLTDVARLLRSERWSARRIRQFQQRRLIAQLRYAVREIPYYRALGVDPGEIAAVEDLQRFPTLTKSIVQREHERLCNPALMDGRVFQSTTSGSSGEPTTTWFDARSWLLCKYAVKIRRTLAAGLPFGQRLLIFDETPHERGAVPRPESRNFLLFRETRLSVFTPMEQQHAVMLRLRPTVVYGSPSGVGELCDYATNHDLPLPRVGTIFLTSELISDEVRRRIETQLRGRVVGIYGSTEFKEVAHECTHGRYHVNFESVYLETRSEPGQESSRLLITSLVNKAMPLIRFDIGDYAQLADDPCRCGRESPYLRNIAGREAEFLELADGRRISPYLLTTAVETTQGLLKYQFVQRADRQLHLRIVLVDPPGGTEAAFDELRRRLHGVLGDGIEVGISRVDTIPRTAAGKQQVVTRAV